MTACTKTRELLGKADSLCQKRGVRLTDQRRRVLEILSELSRPAGAYELLDRLKPGLPGATPPTVYRALEFLLAQGLVHKLESLNAYVGCHHPGEPHRSQFLICRLCGEVREVEDGGVDRSLGSLLDAEGFSPERRVVEITGRCARCRTEGAR
jgi:Fur family zinc uptake transcriptional regulator